MKFFNKVLYRFQYAKYARQLPFYLIRHFGVKANYSPGQVDEMISKYGLNVRFSPIGYALFCKPEVYLNLAKTYQPCPNREQIRSKVADMYFRGDIGYSLYELMQVSLFKSDWKNPGYSSSSEYWDLMAKFKR
ncbi:DUF6559 family protein [Hahella chejuensis]|uniref:DUF6559 family protein n=1 Tax=Hahella chejuensis TaxID=158327 RepID=UPI0005A0C37A|nr:DUF6559 family protein [Hahella chejuensis]